MLPRRHHSCGVIRGTDGASNVIVVAGGYANVVRNGAGRHQNTASVELLRLDTPSKTMHIISSKALAVLYTIKDRNQKRKRKREYIERGKMRKEK